MSCEHKIYLGNPRIVEKTVVRNNVLYKERFFDDVVSSNIPTSTFPEWDENKTDYKIGDWVYIPELGCDYLCGEDGNREYPPASKAWDKVSANDYRHRDFIPTSKSVHNDTIEIVFDAIVSTHLIGNFIYGADTIKVEELDENLNVVKTLDEVKMTKVIDYTCFSCCNPPPQKRKSFVVDLKDRKCANRYIKVTITKHPTASVIEVGTLTVVRAMSIGSPTKKTNVSVGSQLDFKLATFTNQIHAVEYGKTIEINGGAYITVAEKQKLHDYSIDMSGLVFLIFGDYSIIDVAMGVFKPNGLDIQAFFDSEYTFNLKGVLA